VGSRIVVLPPLQKLEEFLGAPLLEKAHERALDGFHLRAGDLGDPAIAINEGTGDLLEFEVSGDVGVDEDLGELARSNDELGDEIDGVVAVAAKLGRHFLIRAEFTIQLSGVCETRGKQRRAGGSPGSG
jgi:hypothetical protein